MSQRKFASGERRKTDRRTIAAAQKASAPIDAEHPLVFETSWEVCSQSGGIYTVLRSKAPTATKKWGDGYWAIGPYRDSAKVEYEPARFEGPVADAIHDLSQQGIVVHSGRWLITGRPRVLLIDLNSVAERLDDYKYFLWKDHGVSIYGRDPECDPIVAFGYAVADLLQAIHHRASSQPMLAHFHEWQGGLAIPLLKARKVKVPLVFTTHATLVGRSLSAANIDLYESLATYDADRVAEQHGILPRHRIELLCAQRADVFTTVSDITALEAQHFLKRTPDVLLPNGLNVERFAAPHEFQVMHREAKEKIHEFVMGHFFPSYTFDLDRTLYFFSAGRYEYRNKGFDVVVDALYELNRRLKAEAAGITVVAFLITRAQCRGLNVQVLNRQAMFHELHQSCDEVARSMGRTLFHTVAAGRLPHIDDLLDESARDRLKRMVHAWTQDRQPMIVTHDLEDDLGDPILCHLRRRQLLNAPDDPVKVVFHPDFITSTSPILGLEYDDFVRGCNLGVFPSYYEPWGYTPMECIVRGVPAITSDLSGFGSYLMDHSPDHDANGMFVARRRRVSHETTVYQVAGWLHALCNMSLRERISMRNRVESYAEMFDWEHMALHYRVARRLAFEKYYPGKQILPADDA